MAVIRIFILAALSADTPVFLFAHQFVCLSTGMVEFMHCVHMRLFEYAPLCPRPCTSAPLDALASLCLCVVVCLYACLLVYVHPRMSARPLGGASVCLFVFAPMFLALCADLCFTTQVCRYVCLISACESVITRFCLSIRLRFYVGGCFNIRMHVRPYASMCAVLDCVCACMPACVSAYILMCSYPRYQHVFLSVCLYEYMQCSCEQSFPSFF